MRHRQRHGDAAGPPDAPLHRHVLESGSDEKRDPRLVQIAPSIEQLLRNAGRCLEELLVAVAAFAIEDGRTSAVSACARYDRGRTGNIATAAAGTALGSAEPEEGQASQVAAASSADQDGRQAALPVVAPADPPEEA